MMVVDIVNKKSPTVGGALLYCFNNFSLQEVIPHPNNCGMPTTATTTNDIFNCLVHDG
jgi:hypothetical protein